MAISISIRIAKLKQQLVAHVFVYVFAWSFNQCNYLVFRYLLRIQL